MLYEVKLFLNNGYFRNSLYDAVEEMVCSSWKLQACHLEEQELKLEIAKE